MSVIVLYYLSICFLYVIFNTILLLLFYYYMNVIQELIFLYWILFVHSDTKLEHRICLATEQWHNCNQSQRNSIW